VKVKDEEDGAEEEEDVKEERGQKDERPPPLPVLAGDLDAAPETEPELEEERRDNHSPT